MSAILGLFWLIFIQTKVSEFLILRATSVYNFRFSLVKIHLDCSIRNSDLLSEYSVCNFRSILSEFLILRATTVSAILSLFLTNNHLD